VRPAFVVGTGRCGSTLLSDLLGLHPDVLSLSEAFMNLLPDPVPDGPVTASELETFLVARQPLLCFLLQHELEPDEFRYEFGRDSRYTRSTGVPPLLAVTLPSVCDEPEEVHDELVAWAGEQPPRLLRGHMTSLFAWLCRRLGRSAWVERSGGSLAYLDVLTSQYPNARYVHLWRDGRTCAASMQRHHGYRLAAIGVRFQRAIGSNPFLPLSTDVPPDLPADLQGLHPGAFERTAYDAADLPIEDFAMAWSALLARGTRLLRALPSENVFHIGYDRLVAAPDETLRSIWRFLDVADPDGVPASAIRERVGDRRPGPPVPSSARLDRAVRMGQRVIERLPT
jgi:hypothetical protein